jgi:hypothetical protein
MLVCLRQMCLIGNHVWVDFVTQKFAFVPGPALMRNMYNGFGFSVQHLKMVPEYVQIAKGKGNVQKDVIRRNTVVALFIYSSVQKR